MCATVEGIKSGSTIRAKVNKGDNLILMEELENWDQVATWGRLYRIYREEQCK